MVKTTEVPVDVLRELLDYDPLSGIFRWKKHRGGKACPGALAGTPHIAGYIRIVVCGRRVFAHRAAWALMTGEWPKGHIDHINSDRTDNRFANLSDKTPTENSRNASRLKNNTSGICGVSWHKKARKWMAVIVVNDRQKYLGLYANIEDAKAARGRAELEYGFDPMHGARIDDRKERPLSFHE